MRQAPNVNSDRVKLLLAPVYKISINTEVGFRRFSDVALTENLTTRAMAVVANVSQCST